MPPEELPNRQLGALVRRLREEHGYSLRRLQELTGVSFDYIAHLERGRIAEPSAERLQRLARALECDVEDFYAATWRPEHLRLPKLPTYLRTQYGLGEAEVRQVQALIDRINQRETARKGGEEHGKAQDKRDRGGTGARPAP